MREYDIIDVSEGIVINKTSISKECDICNYWYFLNKNFDYEPYFCDGCHDLILKAINFNVDAIVSIKEGDYRIHFWYINKDDAISIMNNSSLNKNKGVLYSFSLYKK